MARRKKPSTAEYFLTRVDHEGRTPAECWNWTGPLTNSNYGRLLWNGQRVVAHRVMAMLVEKISDVDAPEFVSHTCKNRRCCNPDHLKIK